MQLIFEYLKNLQLQIDDYAVFGSGPLIFRGVIPPTNVLDVICRGSVWKRAQEIGSLQFSDEYHVDIVTLLNGQVTFGNKWGIGNFDVDALIDDAEHIGGLPFVRLEHVVRCKMIRGSEKDLQHIEALEKSDYSATAAERTSVSPGSNLERRDYTRPTSRASECGACVPGMLTLPLCKDPGIPA